MWLVSIGSNFSKNKTKNLIFFQNITKAPRNVLHLRNVAYMTRNSNL